MSKDEQMHKKLEGQFLRLYDSHADAIFRHAYFRVSDEEVARDLMQTTFERTWEYLAKDNEIGNLKAFLYRVANNMIIDHYRKKKESSLDAIREKGYEPPNEGGVTKLKYRAETRLALEHLETLQDDHKTPIIMRYVDDMSVKEIAEVLGETENNISVRIHRGLKKVQKNIQNNEV